MAIQEIEQVEITEGGNTMASNNSQMPDRKPDSIHVMLGGKTIVGTLGADNKIHYDKDAINTAVKEMIAGQSGKTTGKFNTTAQVVYRYDNSRKTHHNNMWSLWKANPLMQNRITQLNALVFGRGLKWVYEEKTQTIIDRFWRVNRLRRKLNSLGVDAQLYGEVFIGLYPQDTGDVLVSFYESRQVDIDFDPGDVNKVNRYIITYKDEETGKDEQFDMMPIETYLNEIEFSNGINNGVIQKVRKALGLKGSSKVKGKGVMCHIKFNSSTGEVYGTSDFYQVSDLVQDYMDFVGDRLTIHQLYGSPAYDITIDTDDPQVIEDRINELAGFVIGSNPVHNKQEEWKPLDFENGALQPTADDKILRGLISAGMSFPEYMLFNQNEVNSDENTFSVTHLAQDRQDSFAEAFTDIHKMVVACAGGDPSTVDDGQLIFPEIDTMSEKTKAETYVLKVGANLCSRRTASMNMGHNWDIELQQIIEENETFGQLTENSDFAGTMGGRFTSRQNNAANPNGEGDDGARDRRRRNDATRVDTTKIVDSSRKRD